MATAYAALVSLLNNLDLIQHHPLHSFSFENKQIESLLATVLHLIHFMEASDCHGGAAEDLERRIACAAHAAEDVIESHVVDQITDGSTLGWKAKPSFFLPDLQKATEDMESVRREAIKVQKSQSGFKAEQPIFSSTNLTSQKNTMVGFDEELHQLVDLLTGEANRRRVIPIVGMGGIDGSHFPALTDLTLSWLPEMDELPSSIGEMASLRRISLISCRMLLAVSAMRMLVEQGQEFGNEQLQLEVTFGGDSSSRKIFQDVMREEGISNNNLLLYGDWRILRKEEYPDAW